MIKSVVVLLLLALAAGWAWELLAEPPRWEVTEEGAVLTQQAAQTQFRVELLFIGVGVVLCGVWAAVLGGWCRVVGWWLAPLVALSAAAAAVVAWQVGVRLGPPDPSGVTGLAVGETFPDAMQTPSLAAFLLWSVAALGGLVLGLLTTPGTEPGTGEPDTSGDPDSSGQSWAEPIEVVEDQ
ncbi:hypothetical protein [Aeromicrobium sp. CTD01-1L150]|uniref:hypothetical protein n=1 Tax=Aeromicrobium sp. CTD01-1L150 TaxID=3341830 RepID=UPI0035BFE5EC